MAWHCELRRPADVEAVNRLMRVQAGRLRALDPLLPVRDRIPDPDTAAPTLPPLVVRDGRDVVAHAATSVRCLDDDDDLRAFTADVTFTLESLALPDPARPGTVELVDALLASWTAWLRSAQSLPKGRARDVAANALWPSADVALRRLLAGSGLRPTFAFALRSPRPFPSPVHAPAGARVRLAEPRDEQAIVDLHVEEVAFHLGRSPSVRLVPTLGASQRRRLARRWAGERTEDGAPLPVVVELHGEVVGMAECLLVQVRRTAQGRLVPAGRYGYLHTVGVTEAVRGRGLGQLLLTGLDEAFAAWKLDGYTLWYALDNPLSSRFWAQAGFRDLWTIHERRPPWP